MKLHQRLHLTGESFLQNKIIDVVRVAIRCDPALGALLTTQWLPASQCLYSHVQILLGSLALLIPNFPSPYSP